MLGLQVSQIGTYRNNEARQAKCPSYRPTIHISLHIQSDLILARCSLDFLSPTVTKYRLGEELVHFHRPDASPVIKRVSKLYNVITQNSLYQLRINLFHSLHY